MFRFLLLFAAGIFVSGCAVTPLNGTIHNGVYSSPSREFAVTLPTASLLKVTETPRDALFAVDFFTGSLDSKSRLLYSIEWYRIPDDKKTSPFFQEWILSIPTMYLTKNFAPNGRYDFLRGEHITTKQGRSAYVFIGSGVHNDATKPQGSIYGVVIDYGDHIATIYLLNHVTLSAVNDIASTPGYESFDKFFQSFERIGG